MQVIKIDPYNKEVYAIESDMTKLSNIYEELNCSMFTMVRLDEYNDLLLDDCGLLKSNSFFAIEGYPSALAGYGLIVSHDEDGETIESSLSPQQVQKMVRFVDFV